MNMLYYMLDLGRCLLSQRGLAQARSDLWRLSAVTRGDGRSTIYHMVVANLSPDGLRIYVSEICCGPTSRWAWRLCMAHFRASTLKVTHLGR